MTTTRRLAAILATDTVGYSRLMSADEGDHAAGALSCDAQLPMLGSTQQYEAG
jgi:hypothetical protein